ncbi:helix-turn-helix domain-containing protein [Actinophytocola sp.]|uniref:winged helix-turn-helix transcriptional regulator n=1 Tax=Actinophytocola sp. TaxID=1872138 RepID=UPI002ED16D50
MCRPASRTCAWPGTRCGSRTGARPAARLGERWSMLVVRELIDGPKRYVDLLAGLTGVSTDMLAARLRTLEQAGVITRRTLPPPAASKVYELTPPRSRRRPRCRPHLRRRHHTGRARPRPRRRGRRARHRSTPRSGRRRGRRHHQPPRRPRAPMITASAGRRD